MRLLLDKLLLLSYLYITDHGAIDYGHVGICCTSLC